MKKYSRRMLKIALGVVLAYLIILIGGFFGIKNGLTNTAGIVDDKSNVYEEINQENPVQNEFSADVSSEKTDQEKKQLLCQIAVVGEVAPVNAEHIAQTYVKTNSTGLVRKMLLAVQLRLANNQAFVEKMRQCEKEEKNINLDSLVERYRDSVGNNAFPWMNDEQWQAISVATSKDKEVINRVAAETQLPPRLIVSNLIVEQLRLFHSQRELFKKVFEPLKILGNATKISLGVMGVKETTAIAIEEHLHDPDSEYYLGQVWENKLAFSTANPTQERFERLTNDKDHYYSYLYAAMYLKEMMAQWERAGYDIKYRPEIIGTLFNVGFPQSKPKAEPKVGGSEITIGEAKYSFGSLAYEFYYSGEMEDVFPYIVN
ncbi:MAG: hypothetical protein WC823_02425 [Parcubacteria group bacterium]|jgi:hypothetical protein